MPYFTTSDGLSLYFEDAGEGLPVLCLSGLTRNARDFDFVAPHLTGTRLIRMDYRGRGLSGWADAATYTPLREAQDAVELLDHLGVDKVAVLGTSRGGMIALVLAASAKDRLLGVAFNDIGPVVEMSGLDVIMTYLGKNPPFASFEDAAQARVDHMTQFPGVPYERWLQEVTHTNVVTKAGLKINYDPALRDAVQVTMQAPPPDLWPVFDLLADLPVAVIRGKNSDLLSPDTLAEMARRHPGMIAAVVPDRGHIPFLDEPESLAALHSWQEAMA